MGTCFVIQPFDRGRFDKIYLDTFGPAIQAAGLEPYRVDEDPRVAIPIREIERGIQRAEACFAEISTDNPNVWFELGYAISAKKPVVMVCSEDRKHFPFDVQHRTIIHYKTEAPSDFEDLGLQITDRLKAVLEQQMELDEISDLSPVTTSEGLSQHELAGLVIIASYSAVSNTAASLWAIQQDMNRAGYTDIAVTLAVRALIEKTMVRETEVTDNHGDSYPAINISDEGLKWLERHKDQLVLRKDPAQPVEVEPDDDLPF